jgi:hypothetical protein
VKVRCGRKVRFEIRFEINEWMPRAGMTQKLASKFSFKHGRLQLRNHRTDRLAGAEWRVLLRAFFGAIPLFQRHRKDLPRRPYRSHKHEDALDTAGKGRSYLCRSMPN